MDVLNNVLFEMWRDFKDIVKRIVDCYYVVFSFVNVGMIIYGFDVKMLFNFNDKILNNYEVKCIVDKVFLV